VWHRTGQRSTVMTILSAQCTLKQWVSGFLPWMTPYSNLSRPEEPLSTNMFTGQEKLISGSAIIIIIIIIINQFLLSLRGHRVSTKHCHLVLFPAILFPPAFPFF
jgi:hypothetical protein